MGKNDRYGYVLNNPLRYTDPTGELAEDGGGENNWLYGAAIAAVSIISNSWDEIKSWDWHSLGRDIARPFEDLWDNWFGDGRRGAAAEQGKKVISGSLGIDATARSGINVPPINLSNGGQSGLGISTADSVPIAGGIKDLRFGAEWFGNKKDAYNYAIDESNVVDNIEREVSGFALENGEYLVLDASDNTRTRSYNDQLRTRFINDKLEVLFENNWHKIIGHFHTHPGGRNKIDPIGVSRSDLKIMSGSLKNIQMSILHSGNEWLLSSGSQYFNPNINVGYNLENLGPWN